MERKEFLKLAGLAGAASLVPGSVLKAGAAVSNTSSCALIPTETAGPYPLNLSSNAAMFRQDIRETQAGARLDVTLRVMNTNSCTPLSNLRVDIWHCNKDGYYSGYTTSAHLGQQNHVGETWLRGIQMTNANGEVTFTTIFPGWYPGRISHIHFQVFLTPLLSTISQLTFPVAPKNQIYTTDPNYSTWGADPMTFSSDNIFSDGHALQLATLTPNSATGGYDSYLELGINAPTTGVINIDSETGGQFQLLQNFPNPFTSETTIPFTLAATSNVKVSLYNLAGKKVAEIKRSSLMPGEHQLAINPEQLGIARASYVYELEVSNHNGSYRQCKMMTAQ